MGAIPLHLMGTRGDSGGEALPVRSHSFLFRLQKGDELEEGVTSEGKRRCREPCPVSVQTERSLIPAEMPASPSLLFPNKCFCVLGRERFIAKSWCLLRSPPRCKRFPAHPWMRTVLVPGGCTSELLSPLEGGFPSSAVLIV